MIHFIWTIHNSWVLFLFLFFSGVCVCVCVCLLGLNPWHMEVPKPGVKLELQLPTYTSGTATPGLSCVCDLYHSSWQHWILNPLSEARDRTCDLMDTNRIHFCWAMTGTPPLSLLLKVHFPNQLWILQGGPISYSTISQPLADALHLLTLNIRTLKKES